MYAERICLDVLRSLGRFLLAASFLAASPSHKALAQGEENEHQGRHEPKYLFVCAGDQARTSPDFLAVVDFDEDSPHYGQVIGKAPVEGSSATGNEFHHIGLSADGKTVACGGLLSVLKGQDDVFFFDVSDPRAPKFRSSAKPPLSAITDDFHALPEGGFLVTMMGGAQGHAPGRVAEFSSTRTSISSRSIRKIRRCTASIHMESQFAPKST